MTQRIPLKEEKHYLKVNQLQEWKEIPIFWPPKKKEKKEKRRRRQPRVPECCPCPLLAHPWPRWERRPWTDLPLPPDVSNSSSSAVLPCQTARRFPFSQRLLSCFMPEVLISSCWALGKLFQTQGQSWRPLIGGSPTATPHASPVVPPCFHIHNLPKKRRQASTGRTAGKNALFAPSVKCHSSDFFPLLITKTKQRCFRYNLKLLWDWLQLQWPTAGETSIPRITSWKWGELWP